MLTPTRDSGTGSRLIIKHDRDGTVDETVITSPTDKVLSDYGIYDTEKKAELSGVPTHPSVMSAFTDAVERNVSERIMMIQPMHVTNSYKDDNQTGKNTRNRLSDTTKVVSAAAALKRVLR